VTRQDCLLEDAFGRTAAWYRDFWKRDWVLPSDEPSVDPGDKPLPADDLEPGNTAAAEAEIDPSGQVGAVQEMASEAEAERAGVIQGRGPPSKMEPADSFKVFASASEAGQAAAPQPKQVSAPQEQPVDCRSGENSSPKMVFASSSTHQEQVVNSREEQVRDTVENAAVLGSRQALVVPLIASGKAVPEGPEFKAPSAETKDAAVEGCEDAAFASKKSSKRKKKKKQGKETVVESNESASMSIKPGAVSSQLGSLGLQVPVLESSDANPVEQSRKSSHLADAGAAGKEEDTDRSTSLLSGQDGEKKGATDNGGSALIESASLLNQGSDKLRKARRLPMVARTFLRATAEAETTLISVKEQLQLLFAPAVLRKLEAVYNMKAESLDLLRTQLVGFLEECQKQQDERECIAARLRSSSLSVSSTFVEDCKRLMPTMDVSQAKLRSFLTAVQEMRPIEPLSREDALAGARFLEVWKQLAERSRSAGLDDKCEEGRGLGSCIGQSAEGQGEDGEQVGFLGKRVEDLAEQVNSLEKEVAVKGVKSQQNLKELRKLRERDSLLKKREEELLEQLASLEMKRAAECAGSQHESAPGTGLEGNAGNSGEGLDASLQADAGVSEEPNQTQRGKAKKRKARKKKKAEGGKSAGLHGAQNGGAREEDTAVLAAAGAPEELLGDTVQPKVAVQSAKMMEKKAGGRKNQGAEQPEEKGQLSIPIKQGNREATESGAIVKAEESGKEGEIALPEPSEDMGPAALDVGGLPSHNEDENGKDGVAADAPAGPEASFLTSVERSRGRGLMGAEKEASAGDSSVRQLPLLMANPASAVPESRKADVLGAVLTSAEQEGLAPPSVKRTEEEDEGPEDLEELLGLLKGEPKQDAAPPLLPDEERGERVPQKTEAEALQSEKGKEANAEAEENGGPCLLQEDVQRKGQQGAPESEKLLRAGGEALVVPPAERITVAAALLGPVVGNGAGQESEGGGVRERLAAQAADDGSALGGGIRRMSAELGDGREAQVESPFVPEQDEARAHGGDDLKGREEGPEDGPGQTAGVDQARVEETGEMHRGAGESEGLSDVPDFLSDPDEGAWSDGTDEDEDEAPAEMRNGRREPSPGPDGEKAEKDGLQAVERKREEARGLPNVTEMERGEADGVLKPAEEGVEADGKRAQMFSGAVEGSGTAGAVAGKEEREVEEEKADLEAIVLTTEVSAPPVRADELGGEVEDRERRPVAESGSTLGVQRAEGGGGAARPLAAVRVLMQEGGDAGVSAGSTEINGRDVGSREAQALGVAEEERASGRNGGGAEAEERRVQRAGAGGDAVSDEAKEGTPEPVSERRNGRQDKVGLTEESVQAAAVAGGMRGSGQRSGLEENVQASDESDVPDFLSDEETEEETEGEGKGLDAQNVEVPKPVMEGAEEAMSGLPRGEQAKSSEALTAVDGAKLVKQEAKDALATVDATANAVQPSRAFQTRTPNQVLDDLPDFITSSSEDESASEENHDVSTAAPRPGEAERRQGGAASLLSAAAEIAQERLLSDVGRQRPFRTSQGARSVEELARKANELSPLEQLRQGNYQPLRVRTSLLAQSPEITEGPLPVSLLEEPEDDVDNDDSSSDGWCTYDSGVAEHDIQQNWRLARDLYGTFPYEAGYRSLATSAESDLSPPKRPLRATMQLTRGATAVAVGSGGRGPVRDRESLANVHPGQLQTRAPLQSHEVRTRGCHLLLKIHSVYHISLLSFQINLDMSCRFFRFREQLCPAIAFEERRGIVSFAKAHLQEA
jgi:hypothetical protein